MRSPVHCLLVTLILAFWSLPSAAGLAVGLHLALEHHHDADDAMARQAWIDLALVAVHGHHHDVGVVPDHRHDAVTDGLGPLLKAEREDVAGSVISASPAALPLDALSRGGCSTRGPPPPLFTHHCALLL